MLTVGAATLVFLAAMSSLVGRAAPATGPR
jgi:hypothetical protein